jgi:hypothetical protein
LSPLLATIQDFFKQNIEIAVFTSSHDCEILGFEGTKIILFSFLPRGGRVRNDSALFVYFE